MYSSCCLPLIMSKISIEALAMAGVDHVEWGMDVEEWEREDVESEPPLHLFAEEEEEAEKEEEEALEDEVTKVSEKERLFMVGSIRKWLNLLKIIEGREMDIEVLGSGITYEDPTVFAIL